MISKMIDIKTGSWKICMNFFLDTYSVKFNELSTISYPSGGWWTEHIVVLNVRLSSYLVHYNINGKQRRSAKTLTVIHGTERNIKNNVDWSVVLLTF